MTPAVTPGGRWLPLIRAGYANTLAKVPVIAGSRIRARLTHDEWKIIEDERDAAQEILNLLDDPEYRRIVVDAQQAMRFAEAGGMPPVEHYRRPFEQCYIEFTEPIKVGEDQAGHDDLLAALMIRPYEHGRELDGTVTAREIVTVTFLLIDQSVDSDDDSWANRSFMFDCTNGGGLTRVGSMVKDANDPSVLPEVFMAAVDSDELFIAARPMTEGGSDDLPRGWWERTVVSHSQFVGWLLTYLTAKGIVIVEEEQSRQVRRAQARMAHRPPAWHVVRVQPTYVHDDDAEPGSGRAHSYRYDVRGHIRFGRHPRKDGTYATGAEWIAPHQRGLANTVYVPKTYHYDGRSPKVNP